MTPQEMLDQALRFQNLELLQQAFAKGARVDNETFKNRRANYDNTIYAALQNNCSPKILNSRH